MNEFVQELEQLNTQLDALVDRYYVLAGRGTPHARYEMISHICGLLSEAVGAGQRTVKLINMQERSMENDQAQG